MGTGSQPELYPGASPSLLGLSFPVCESWALQRMGGFGPRGYSFESASPSQACKEKTDAFLFLFSFTDRASFEDLPGQLTRVAGEAPGVVRMVIGSKYPLGGP